MHPTPAVGGEPWPGAAAAIAELEQMDRGWYAGPVGWMDATEDGGGAWASLRCNGDMAQLCIGDSGVGMSDSFVHNRLFKPFQSTKPAGMGIGAFESLQYVQELGGSIAVQSTEGEGTLLTLQLPLAETQLAALTAVAADPPVRAPAPALIQVQLQPAATAHMTADAVNAPRFAK